MASEEVEKSGKDLLEVEICDGDGVWSPSAADLREDFAGFQQWSGPESEPEPRGEVSGAPPRSSIVDRLLVELYYEALGGGGAGRWRRRSGAEDSWSSTEASGSDAAGFPGRGGSGSRFLQELQERHTRRRQVTYLTQKAPEELSSIVQEVKHRTALQSTKLLRQLRRRDRLLSKLHKNYDIITACLQAVSQKRRVDTRLKFTIEPSLGKNGFQQWYDALKAVARLPTGIPKEWRKRVWLTLADQYLHTISIDWEKTLRFAFNERSNPDDDSLGIQIVKDLHRTGCSSYCGQEGEQDRVVLKRVLLAYARWNKTVGYCQGFNVLAALILEVTEGNESDALKVMIYLIDKVLPDSYFANNLRALSVDMAVFRDLLRLKLPRLSQHLHHLQKAANREAGGSYEPPLTNVFTMQWFLTMFATCLPASSVLKIWDSVFFEGSEVLFRVALAIWERLGERIEYCQTADEFYSTMGGLTQEMLENNLLHSTQVMQEVYSMAVFPFPQLAELREKYTYNITPFPSSVRPSGSRGLGGWESDDDDADMDDEDSVVTALGCLGPLGGLLAPELHRYQRHLKDQRADQQANMAELSPGAVGGGAGGAAGGAGRGGARAEHQAAINSMMMERMSTDIYALKKQYGRIKRRQQQQAMQLCIRSEPETATSSGILPEVSNSSSDPPADDKCPATRVLPSQLNPSSCVINHLLLGRKQHRPSSPSRGQNDPAGRRRHASSLSETPGSPGEGTPWREHVRQHRRNVARARAQLGFQEEEREGGGEEEGEESTRVEKDGKEEVKIEENEERKEASDSSMCEESERRPKMEEGEEEEKEKEKEEEEAELRLESLDLEAESNPTYNDEPPQIPLLLPPPPPPSSRKEFDSSSTSDGLSPPPPSSSIPSSSPPPSTASPSSLALEAESNRPNTVPLLLPPPSSRKEADSSSSTSDGHSPPPHPSIPSSSSSPRPSSLDLEAESDQPDAPPSPPSPGLESPPPPHHSIPSSPSSSSPTTSSSAPKSRLPPSTSAHALSSLPGSAPFYKTASPSTPSLSSLNSSADPDVTLPHSSSSSFSSSSPKQQVFSPFPCVKPPRRSAAARNLGLYGPTARTPTVHFPQLSRNLNRSSAAGTAGTTGRR